jgi:hypothetical protein
MQIPATAVSSYAAPAAQGAQGVVKAAADPVADFLNFVGKTPAEQMRAQILHELGLKEEDLKAMDPKERLKVEQKIKELVREKVQETVEKQTGVAVDIKA